MKKALIASVIPLISFAFSLSDITSSSSEIDKSIGETNAAINKILGGNYEDILGKTSVDNELISCLVGGTSLSSILGNTPRIDGICGMMNSGLDVGNILSDPVARCLITGSSRQTTEIQDSLRSFCNNSHGSTGSNTNEWGWTSGTGNESSTAAPTKTYSPVGVVGTALEVEGANGGVSTTSGEKDLGEKTFPGGITGEELYSGTDGGKIYENMKKNLDGADAMAVKTNNKNTLILKEMALKLNNTTDENTIHLPQDKLAVIKAEDVAANIVALGGVDHFALTDYLVKEARKTFAGITADSLDEYYKKELQAYLAMIKSDTNVGTKIVSIKENAMRAIGYRYEMKLLSLKKDPNYIFNPSYTAEVFTKEEYKDDFKARSLFQMNEEAAIKSDMAKEKRRVSMLIDKTVQEAYYLASIFRADIAKKEVDEILKAVDKSIN